MNKSIEFLSTRNSMLFFYTFAPEAFDKLSFESKNTNYKHFYDFREFQEHALAICFTGKVYPVD